MNILKKYIQEAEKSEITIKLIKEFKKDFDELYKSKDNLSFYDFSKKLNNLIDKYEKKYFLETNSLFSITRLNSISLDDVAFQSGTISPTFNNNSQGRIFNIDNGNVDSQRITINGQLVLEDGRVTIQTNNGRIPLEQNNIRQ